MRDTDIVPALLSPQEHVINRGAVDLVGGKTLANLNIVGRQIMSNNPQRYNKPDGIDNTVPMKLPRLGAKFDKGNGVQGNIPGLAGVVKNGNSYSQAPGFIPKNTVRTPTGIFPRYQDGTDENGIRPLQAPGLLETLRNMMAVSDDPVTNQQMPQQMQPTQQNYAPTLDEARQNFQLQQGLVQKYARGGEVYSKIPIDTYPADPKRFGFQGVPSNKQLIPSGQQRLPSIIGEPVSKSSKSEEILTKFNKPSFTPGQSPEAKAYMESMGKAPGEIVDGAASEGLGGSLKGFGKGIVAGELLDAGRRGLYNALPKTPVGNVLGAGLSALTGDTESAKQMFFGQPVDYAPQLTRSAINLVKNPSVSALSDEQIIPSRSANQETTVKPNKDNTTVDLSGNQFSKKEVVQGTDIYQDKQPYRLQQFGGAPYIEGKPVNTLNIDDGTGGKGLVQFADGRGLSPQQMSGLESRIAYNTANRDKYQANADKYYADEARKAQDANLQNLQNLALYGGGTGDMDPVSYIQANRRQKAAAGLLSGAQDYSLGRGELNQKQNVFDASQQQQQFQNKLGLADIGIKTKTAKAEAEKEANKFALDQIKAAPLLHQSQLLEALSAGIKNKVTDTPEYSQLVKLYQMAFGKNPMDDLMAGQQGLQQS